MSRSRPTIISYLKLAQLADHFAQRVAYVNALVDGAQANASLRSQGIGLLSWMHVTP